MFHHLKLSVLVLALSTTASLGHEFWIDPLDFTVDPGTALQADLRVGQGFEGSPYSFIPQNFGLFELAQGATRAPVEGRTGDRPALNQAAMAEGLNVVLHVTRDYDLTYTALEKFADFVHHKDADWALEQHKAEGFPEAGFVEVYSRYAKSLISVGNGAGADQNYGLLTEIVALANPYTDDVSAGMPVQVFYDGAVRADTQVELFAKYADGTVVVTTYRTNANGIATLPVQPGLTYMADAVVLRQPDSDFAREKGALWESLWANLTFAVPE
jgi:uncharacterized GH25 family protein